VRDACLVISWCGQLGKRSVAEQRQFGDLAVPYCELCEFGDFGLESAMPVSRGARCCRWVALAIEIGLEVRL